MPLPFLVPAPAGRTHLLPPAGEVARSADRGFANDERWLGFVDDEQ